MNQRAQKGIIERKVIRKSPFSVQFYNFNESILQDNYPAKMPSQFARDMILQYSNPGDWVCDPFAGSGTTLREAYKEGRLAIGFDINEKSIELIKQDPIYQKANENDSIGNQIRKADSRDLSEFVPESTIDLVVTSPPYGTIIAGKKVAYSDDPRDLSNSENYEDFRRGLKDCLKEIFRILKPGAILVINVKSRNKTILRPLPAYVMVDGIEVGFWPWTEFILPTHPYMIWTFGPEKYRKAIPAHEYVAVFRKPDPTIKLTDHENSAKPKVVIPTNEELDRWFE